jgi:hypothetical protein
MLLALAGEATASAADLNLGPGAYTVDTTAMTISGPGTSATGVDQGGVAVFTFDNVSVPVGATVNVQGIRPFKLLATGSLTVAGAIDGNGTSATDFSQAANPGGPGGGAGGSTTNVPGLGPGGGGGSADINNGGGGGGFGGVGARGGIKSGSLQPAGTGGGSYGDLNASLQGGSGGGGGALTGGGGGGGAIALFSSSVTVAPSGSVRANGGGGAVGSGGASGGGSGGAIVIHADTVEVNGTLEAAGGEGGAGGCCGDGGGGGGGRIAYQYRTLLASGTAIVSGGTSGIRDTGACGCSHGALSLDPTGAPGVVTKAQAPIATTGPATAVSSVGATLNGTVNPNLNATSYSFDYGISGTYGSRVPASPVSIGSDGSDHLVSQTLTGLAPNTTYHYRVVAVDAMGFTTFGSDIGFTTSAAAAGPEPITPLPPKHKKCKKGKKLKHGKCVRKKHHRHHKR